MEQRNKILGEWDEEEDDEAEVEEKKKVKENLGETVDSDMSEIESDQEAYFQDDNINNYHGDDSDEEFFEDKNNKISDLINKMESENDNDTTENEEKTVDTSTDKNNGTTAETATIDVAKVLEETQVPELPDLDALSAPLPGSGGSSKKSVKFSAQVAKEIAITKMALVQPKSNMVGPMEVQDEFDFDDSDNLQSIPRFSKTILKKRSKSPPPPQSSSAVASSTSEVTSNVTSTETSEAEVAMSLQPPVTGVTSSEALVTSSEDTSTSEAAATMLALGQPQEAMASNEVNKEETYLLVVEDGQQLDQLNSQTFYIDSNSLANGDYSKMVLATSGGSVDQNSEQQAASKIDSTEVTAAAME